MEFLKITKNISFYEDKISDEKKKIIINGIKDEFELFPKRKIGTPDTAEVLIIIRAKINQIQQGVNYPLSSAFIRYND